MIYENRGHKEHIRSLLYLALFVLFFGYQIVNVFVPNADMILSVRILAVGFYVGVMYVYGADAARAFMSKAPKRSDFLIVGIWISFLSHFLQCVYSIVYRLAPSEWLLYSEVVSPIVMLSIIAAMLHVGAPGSVDGVVPRRNKIALGVSVGMAAVFVVGLLASRPNVRPYIQSLRPYIGDWFNTDPGLSNSAPSSKTPAWSTWPQSGPSSHSGPMPPVP